MSLTNLLKDKNSHINHYFNTYFDFNTLINDNNNDLKNSFTIKPKNFNDYPWSDVGHIVEYLLNIHIQLPFKNLLPMVIAKKMYPEIYNYFLKKYEVININNQFESLCLDLYRLSNIEKGFRTGEYPHINELKLLKLNNIIINDISNIYLNSICKNILFNNFANKFYYNPSFELSHLVNGADADLYQIKKEGNYLIDLKTTVKPSINDDMIKQLISYVFLDNYNSHNFKSIGIYLPRQNLISEWNLDSIISNTSSFNSVSDAKNNFINMLHSKKYKP